MNSDSPGCRDTFFSITGVIGFIVDTITLISIIGVVNISSAQPSVPFVIPELALGSITFEWVDVTLVILIYVGIAFTISSIRHVPTFGKPNLLNPLIRYHLLAGLVLLWLMLFVPFGDIQLYSRVCIAWLLGFVILMVLRKGTVPKRLRSYGYSNEDFPEGDIQKFLINRVISITKFFAGCIVVLVIILPAWTLLEKGINHISWGGAFTVALGWGLMGLAGSFVLWGTVIVMLFAVAVVKSLIEQVVGYSKTNGSTNKHYT